MNDSFQLLLFLLLNGDFLPPFFPLSHWYSLSENYTRWKWEEVWGWFNNCCLCHLRCLSAVHETASIFIFFIITYYFLRAQTGNKLLYSVDSQCKLELFWFIFLFLVYLFLIFYSVYSLYQTSSWFSPCVLFVLFYWVSFWVIFIIL